MATSVPLVSAQQVQIWYGDFCAIREVSFAVERGEKFAIIGPSGCGKTTLLQAVAGFTTPTRGSIFVNGVPVGEPGPDRAVVFQDFNQLFPWRTVIGNIVYALGVAKRVSRREAVERAREMLSLVGIAAASAKYPHQLSGGMKQRVAIARALALEPDILLLDEPFGALDAITRGQLQLELDAIWQRTGVTILLVTHSIQEAILLGQHVLVMSGTPASVREIVDTESASVGSARFSELSNHLRSLLITSGQRERVTHLGATE